MRRNSTTSMFCKRQRRWVKELASCQSPNKQLQRTVIPQHVRATSASFHYALVARLTRQRAAAELRR